MTSPIVLAALIVVSVLCMGGGVGLDRFGDRRVAWWADRIFAAGAVLLLLTAGVAFICLCSAIAELLHAA